MGIVARFVPMLAMIVWLDAVDWFAGTRAAFCAAVTGLGIAMIALWEAGRSKAARAVLAQSEE